MVRRQDTRWSGASFAVFIGITMALSGCAARPSTATTPTTTPTTATTPSPWHQVALPGGRSLNDGVGVAVSPLEGSTAWVCALASASTFTVWTTHDAGATWRQRSTVSPAGPANPRSCALTTDDRDPHTVVVMFTSGAGAAGDLRTISYLSTDGGAQWTRVPGLVGISQIDSAGGQYYAILNDTAADPASQQPQLVMSADGLQTWKELRPASLVAHDALVRFWLDPSRAQLFAAPVNGGLWQTTDAGALWTEVRQSTTTPSGQIDLGAWLPLQRQWDFCGWSAQPTIVQCSTDLGATWHADPRFSATTSCARCATNVPAPDTSKCFPNALKADGSLLADCVTADSPANAPTFGVYRLPLGGTAWQRLTTVPALLLAVPATGAVWYSGRGYFYTDMLPS